MLKSLALIKSSPHWEGQLSLSACAKAKPRIGNKVLKKCR